MTSVWETGENGRNGPKEGTDVKIMEGETGEEERVKSDVCRLV